MLSCAACLLVSLFVLVPSAMASSVGGCQLQGTANFSPGLNSSTQPFTYNFGGGLTGCQSSEPGVPTSGSVAAGQTLTEQVTNSKTGAIDTVTYQEPVPSGNGGCASSTTSGSALATWADGSQTVVAYSTTGALAAVHLTGSVAPSMTLTAVNAKEGDPTTFDDHDEPLWRRRGGRRAALPASRTGSLQHTGRSDQRCHQRRDQPLQPVGCAGCSTMRAGRAPLRPARSCFAGLRPKRISSPGLGSSMPGGHVERDPRQGSGPCAWRRARLRSTSRCHIRRNDAGR